MALLAVIGGLVRDGDALRGEYVTRKEVLRAEAREFHRANPEVWKLFVEFTFDRIGRGFKHYSADAIMHRVRWETGAGDPLGEFKINNNYVSFYARAFSKMYPEHAGFFRMRRQISGDRRDPEI
jgi:hypothetical protein